METYYNGLYQRKSTSTLIWEAAGVPASGYSRCMAACYYPCLAAQRNLFSLFIKDLQNKSPNIFAYLNISITFESSNHNTMKTLTIIRTAFLILAFGVIAASIAAVYLNIQAWDQPIICK